MSSLIPLRLLLPPLSPTQYPPFQLPKSSFKSFSSSSSSLPCAWNTTSSSSKRRRKWLCRHLRRDQYIDNQSTEDKSGMQMFGSDEEIGTQIPTQAQSIVEGSGSVMVSEFRPAADVDYLQELLAIQQQGPRSIGFFGTRNMGFMHQELIEILSYAMVITKNHIYTSGASGTNAAVIRGALRAENPELLTVILPQSLKKQPPESQELLSKVKNVLEKPHNDHLPLLEASRFSNYMDKCSGGQTYLTVDKHDKVSLRPLKSLETLAEADWKSYNPPKKLNHREFRFWVSRSTRKCLTVFGGNKKKRTVGVADCKFNGSNRGQLFAFRFHYHQAFCCCGVHNE